MSAQNGAYLTIDRVLEQGSALETTVPGGGILMRTIFRRFVERVRAWTAVRHAEYYDIRERREATMRKERYTAAAMAEMAWKPWR